MLLESPTIYDARTVSRILGLRAMSRDPAPIPGSQDLVIYYGGWRLEDLLRCKAGKTRMGDWNWYVSPDRPAEPGYYHLLLRVPDSNDKAWSGQLRHLAASYPEWQPASAAVVATALLVHLAAVDEDLLNGDRCRCAELIDEDWTRGEYHLDLGIDEDRVSVYPYRWDGRAYDHLWLAASRLA